MLKKRYGIRKAMKENKNPQTRIGLRVHKSNKWRIAYNKRYLKMVEELGIKTLLKLQINQNCS